MTSSGFRVVYSIHPRSSEDEQLGREDYLKILAALKPELLKRSQGLKDEILAHFKGIDETLGALVDELNNKKKIIRDSFEDIDFFAATASIEGMAFEADEIVELEYKYNRHLGLESIKTFGHQLSLPDSENYFHYYGLGFERNKASYSFEDSIYRFKYSFNLTSGEHRRFDHTGSGLGLTFIPDGYQRSLIQVNDESSQNHEIQPFMSSFPHFINMEPSFRAIEDSSKTNVPAAMTPFDFEKLILEMSSRGSLLSFIGSHANAFPKRELQDLPGALNTVRDDGLDGTAYLTHTASQERAYEELEKILGKPQEDKFGNIAVFHRGPLLYHSEASTYVWRNDFGDMRQSMKREWMDDEGLPEYNILFLLDRQSLDEAILRLQKRAFPVGTKAIHFLFATTGQDDLLAFDDPQVIRFFKLIQRPYDWKIRVNAHTVPGIHRYYKKVVPQVMEPCEGGRFSCYISPEMKLHPCRYFQDERFAVSLRDHTIAEAWTSEPFEQFRALIRDTCDPNSPVDNCASGCPLLRDCGPDR